MLGLPVESLAGVFCRDRIIIICTVDHPTLNKVVIHEAQIIKYGHADFRDELGDADHRPGKSVDQAAQFCLQLKIG